MITAFFAVAIQMACIMFTYIVPKKFSSVNSDLLLSSPLHFSHKAAGVAVTGNRKIVSLSGT